MLPQISDTAFFCFALAVLCVGYIFVEILFGDKYFFRKSLDRNSGNLFDRILHYIMWGILINFVFIVFNAHIGGLYDIANIFNSSSKIAQLFAIKSASGIDTTYSIPAQIIIFAIWYFIEIMIIMILFFGAARIGSYLGRITRRLYSKKKKSKK